MASDTRYGSYAEVPLFRRQWFFWLAFFFVAPVALAVLVTGDVYYPKKGAVASFGIANRVVASVFALLYLGALFNRYLGV